MPCCENTIAGVYLPNDAELLTENGCETRVVYRVGGIVRKHLRKMSGLRPEQIRLRSTVAAAHPDLFAPISYDEAKHAIEQPYIEGREATAQEVIAVDRTIKNRGESRVCDLGPSNILIRPNGSPCVIDFAVGIGPTPVKPGITRSKGCVTVCGPITAEQRAELGWPV